MTIRKLAFEFDDRCVAEFRPRILEDESVQWGLYTKGMITGVGNTPLLARDDAVRRLMDYADWLTTLSIERTSHDADRGEG